MRERIDAAFGAWGRWVSLHAPVVTLLVLAVTALLGTQLQYFRLETTMESYFHEEDPVRLQYDAFRDLFGRDAVIVLALEPEGGVFQAEFLEELRTLHEEIEEEIPYLVEVTSLVNIRQTIGSADGLEVDDFLALWPETTEELADARARALDNPLYRNLVISKDATITSIVIELEAYIAVEEAESLAGFESDSDAEESHEPDRRLMSGEDDSRVMRALEKILDRHRAEDLDIHLAGMPAFNADVSGKITHDMLLFSGLSIGLIGFFLALLFRRVAAVLLPLVTVILSVLATLAFMGATGTPLMPPTQIIPSFLLAVGIGGAVHVLTMFYQAQRRGDDKSTAISFALAHSGLPIVMTSLTTAGGLISFMPAALRPISHFGWVTPIGVLLSLFFVLTLLPALIVLTPMQGVEAAGDDTRSQKVLIALGSFSTRRGGLVLGMWAVLIAISVVGMFRLRLGNDMVRWYPADAPMRQAIEFIDEELGGSATLELVVSAGEENAFHEPDLLRRLEQIHEFTAGFEEAGLRADKVISIVDVVKESNQALNENRTSFYSIPDSRELVAQELLLFENSGSDDVEDLVTTQFDVARMTIRVPFIDGAVYVPFMREYLDRVETILGPNVSAVLTGTIPLLGHTIGAALDTMIRSYLTALIVITLLMIALIGSLRVGLLAMIPNLAPVFFGLGLMGWLGITVDMMNLMLGSIVIGLAVDDTIHFMHNFRREVEKSGDVPDAVKQTLRGTGQALLFTSCVLATGFLVYTQAYMSFIFDFGILTASAIAIAFLADVTLAPALVSMVAWKGGAEKGPQ